MAEGVLLTEWPCRAVEDWITTFQRDFKGKFGADMPTSVLIGLILTDWIASRAAETSAYGKPLRRWHLIEVDAEGHMVTDEELYTLLLNEYAARIRYERG